MIDESRYVKFLQFHVEGRPVPWKSPNVTRRGAYAVLSYANYKRKVRDIAQIEMYLAKKRISFARTALRLRIFVMGNREPDNTNILKSVEDGLKGTVIHDDKQVKEQETNFEYVSREEDERVEIEVWIDANGEPPKAPPKKIAKSVKKV